MKSQANIKPSKKSNSGIQASIRECFLLLLKSCDRFGQLKESKAPEVVMDMERTIMQKRLMLLFNMDQDLKN